MVSAPPLFQVVTALFAIVIAFIAVQLAMRVKRNGPSAMVRLRLMPEKTVRDFDLMAVGSSTIFAAFLVWIVGAVVDTGFYNVARGFATAGTALFVYVFFRWWKRL